MSAPTCQLCAKRPAMYVCQECGRHVCGSDFVSHAWSCTDCYARHRPEEPRAVPAMEAWGWPAAWWLFVLSFAVIFIGMILMMLASITSAPNAASGGAVIFIGPIPILLGFGPISIWLIGFAVIITVIAVALFLLARRRA